MAETGWDVEKTVGCVMSGMCDLRLLPGQKSMGPPTSQAATFVADYRMIASVVFGLAQPDFLTWSAQMNLSSADSSSSFSQGRRTLTKYLSFATQQS